LVTIGKFIRSQGKRGELRFKPYFEHSLKHFFFMDLSSEER